MSNLTTFIEKHNSIYKTSSNKYKLNSLITNEDILLALVDLAKALNNELSDIKNSLPQKYGDTVYDDIISGL